MTLQPGTLCYISVPSVQDGDASWICPNNGHVVEIVSYRGYETFTGGVFESYVIRASSPIAGVMVGVGTRVMVHPGEEARAARPTLRPFYEPPADGIETDQFDYDEASD